MKYVLTEDSTELAEFRGQMVDILEDALSEVEAEIPNSDRDEAIADGEDPKELAIIFGEDYDVIGNVVEEIVRSEKLSEKPISDSKVKDAVVNQIMESYEEVIRMAVFPGKSFTKNDKQALREKVKETFIRWELFV